MSIPIRDAVILWHDNTARVGITTQAYGVSRFERENGGTFWNNEGDCTSWWAIASDTERLQHLLELLVSMIDDNGVEEAAARAALLVVDEWRSAFSDPRALDAAMRIRRAEVAEYGNEYMIARGAPVRQ